MIHVYIAGPITKDPLGGARATDARGSSFSDQSQDATRSSTQHKPGGAMAKTKKTGTSPKNHSLEIGKSYFVRGVTHYYTGRLIAVTETDLVLEDAAWIADTGRFATAMKEGPAKLNEVEPFFRPAIVSRAAIVDITEWPHALPSEQK